jgi:hypothetical protein
MTSKTISDQDKKNIKSRISAAQSGRSSLKGTGKRAISDQDKKNKKRTGQTISDQDVYNMKRKKPTGSRTISDQDISKIVSRLYAAISGRTSSKSIGKEALGKAKGGKRIKAMLKGEVAAAGAAVGSKALGKIKKRASGGRVKKSK